MDLGGLASVPASYMMVRFSAVKGLTFVVGDMVACCAVADDGSASWDDVRKLPDECDDAVETQRTRRRRLQRLRTLLQDASRKT